MRRHCPAVRTFWAQVAHAVDGDAELLTRLVAQAATGPATVRGWLAQVNGPHAAVMPIEKALMALDLPATVTRPQRLERVREVVRGTGHVTLFRAEPSMAAR